MPLIAVKTAALARLYPAQAFYDTTGDTMSVGIKQKGKFKSTIDGEDCSFDLTRDGKILNIDIWTPRRDWTIEKAIHPPENYSTQNVLFDVDHSDLVVLDLLTNPDHTILNIKFSRDRVSSFVSSATSLIFELDDKNHLLGLWITSITEDVNFQKEGEWRRSIKPV